MVHKFLEIIAITSIFTSTINSQSTNGATLSFPKDSNENSAGIGERYGGSSFRWPGGFGQCFTPQNFGFGRNPFIPQYNPQNQINYPQTQQFFPQNQQFFPQNQQFRPQNQNFGQPSQQQQNQQFNPQQNQQQSQMSTTVAPQVQACIESCVESTPGQYNPLCGTDDTTYHNQERLNCAIECGQNVQAKHTGACPRPTLPPWQRGRK